MEAKRKLSNLYEEDAKCVKKPRVDEPQQVATIFANKIVSLKDRSAMNVAIWLWQNHHSEDTILLNHSSPLNDDPEDDGPGTSWNPGSHQHELVEKVLRSLQNLPILVPAVISNLIEESLRMVIKRIRIWVSYHKSKVFHSDSRKTVKHCDKIVWKSDGTIDDMQTATNMLSTACKTLSSRERYRIMCTYCLEEEIEKLSTLQYNDCDISTINSYALVFYWNHRIRNELHAIRGPLNESAESRIITMADNIHAVRYLWKFISPYERVAKARSLLACPSGVKFKNFLANELEADELNRLLIDIGPELIRNCATHLSHVEEAWQLWSYSKHYFTNEQYLKLIMYLKDLKNDFLFDVWQTTPTPMKRFVLMENTAFLYALTVHPSHNLERSISQLIHVLPDMDFERRINIIEMSIPWASIFQTLIHQYKKPRLLETFLKLCVSSEDVRRNLKNLWIDTDLIEEHALDLIYERKWNLLEEFLNSYELSAPVNEFKTRIFLSNDSFFMAKNMLMNGRYDVLNEIIDRMIPCAKSATDFRLKVLTCKFMQRFFLTDMSTLELQDKIERCVTTFLTHPEDVKLLKQHLIERYHPKKHPCPFYTIKSTALYRLLTWCLDDDEAAERYKSSVDLEKCFEYLLNDSIEEANSTYRWMGNDRPYNFSRLENFLLWYFNYEVDKVKEFKIARMNNFYNLNAVNKYLEKRSYIRLRPLVKWFYDDDENLIEKFKSTIMELSKSVKLFY